MWANSVLVCMKKEEHCVEVGWTEIWGRCIQILTFNGCPIVSCLLGSRPHGVTVVMLTSH